MLDLWEAIKTRRSIRKLTGELSFSSLLKPLEAARWAPSAHNAQPWRFLLILDPQVKRSLAEAMAEAWVKDLIADGVEKEAAEKAAYRSVRMIVSSPVAIVVCLTMEDMQKYPDERRRRAEYLMAVQSVAAAAQNLLLALHAEGLGACWLCAPLFCQEAVRGALGIPSDVEPQALVIVGRPAESPLPPPRRQLNEVLFINRWGVKP
ncbi:MAG: nitroreductase family protein [Thermoprotei archaeon]|nr:MAG: nitroreductase family protein [Thermoprotei archaeon]